jgi:O-antigen/teichoic acid export membrane protein
MTSNRRRLVGNSLAILANQVTQNATSFILSISIARILGPYELGQYSLAFSYYYIFMTMSSQGLKTLLTRELAKFPEKVQTCLVSGTLLQFIFSSIGFLALVGLVALLPYKPATAVICYMVGAALIPYGISNVTEAIFQSQEKMHLIAISTVPIYILRLIVMILALKLEAGINAVGLILVVSEVLILLIEWFMISRIVKPIEWKIDWQFMRDTAKAARTFVAIESFSVFKVRMQVLILSLLAGETIVGLYSAAVQLLQPFQLISLSLAVASLPTMTKSTHKDDDKVRRLAESIVSVLLVVAVPMIAIFAFMGGAALVFIYRDGSFADSGLALVILSLTMIPLSFTRSLSYVMIAYGFQRVNLRTVMINTITGAILSVILISSFGIIGAAVSALIVEASGAGQFIFAVRARIFSLQLWNIIRAPLLAGALMLVLLVAMESFSPSIVIALILAGMAYVAIVGVVSVQRLDLSDAILNRVFRRHASQPSH